MYPSDHIKSIWPEKIEDFPDFISALYVPATKSDPEIYKQVAFDDEKNRRKLIQSFAMTLFQKTDRLKAAYVHVYPYFEAYTLTEKDKENPYLAAIQDEPIVKIEMQVNF